jgi:hypothetical protein
MNGFLGTERGRQRQKQERDSGEGAVTVHGIPQ